MQAVAERIGELAPETQVRCAYLELMEPDLPAAVRALIAAGATSICVLPMFLGVGRHAREDLPELMHGLQREHQQVLFSLQPAIGEDARLVDMMARIALS